MYQVPWNPGPGANISKYTFAREAICTLTLGSVTLPGGSKIIAFTTLTAGCCNVRKAHYLLYFS